MNQSELVQLQAILTAFLSHENSVRSTAERTIDQNFSHPTNREKFITGLLQLLRTSNAEQIRSLSAVLLRKKLPNGEPILFEKLGAELQEATKTELLKALSSESQRYVRTQICDAIADLAECLLHKDQWPALLPFLVKCCTEGADPLKVSALSIFGKLFDTQYDALESKLELVRGIYSKALSSTSLPVRAEAVFVLCKTVANMDDEKERKKFQPSIPIMLKVLGELFREGETHGALRILSSMVELATECSTFFRAQLENVAKAMLQVGQSSELEDGPRQLAMELLVALAEDNASMVRKHGVVISASVTLACSLMLTVEEDSTWTQQEETPDLFDGSNVDCGEIAIDRLAQAIGGKKFVPVMFPIIADFFKRDDWKFRHAGLKALSQAGEVAEFEQLPLKEVIAFLKDKNPRVRYAAVNCVGQLASDFQPTFQQNLHKVVIPSLVDPLQDGAHPRVQAHSAGALCNFLVNCNEQRLGDLVGPYVDNLLKVLMGLLQNPASKRMVREQVMTAIAALAGAAPTKFKKFYKLVVPPLKMIIEKATTKELASLRSRAMECITFIGMAVGAELFKKDAGDLAKLFLDIMKKGGAPDDVNMQYMLQAWTRICSVIGKEFVPCLPHVIPWIFNQAKKTVDFSTVDSDSDPDIHIPDSLRTETRALTSALEDKATACSMICSFVHDLQEAFFPYVKEAATIMIPLMSYYLNDDIRQYAISCMPDLLSSAFGALEKKATDMDTVKTLFVEITSGMIKCFKTEPDTDLLQTMVGSLQMCVGVAGELARTCLDKGSLQVVGEALLKLLQKSHQRIQGREDRKKTEDFDEEALATIMEANASENELNFMVSECIGALIQSHKEAFLPTFDTVLPEILRMLDVKSPPSTRKIALFIIDDVAEHLGTAAGGYYKHFVPAYLAYVNDESVELRQASAYGLAMCAQHGRQHFQPFVDEAIKRLVVGIKAAGSRSPDNASATDNMISALFRIAVNQNRPQILPDWLGTLPLLSDEEEANWVYDQMCGLVESNNVAFLGKDFKNLPKIACVLVEILSTPDLLKMVQESVTSRMMAILQKLKAMPGDGFSKLTQQMTPKHVHCLRELLSKGIPSTSSTSSSSSSSSSSASSSSASGSTATTEGGTSEGGGAKEKKKNVRGKQTS